MKRIIQGCLLLLAALLLPSFAPAEDAATAEAAVSQPRLEVAQRELKKDKNQQVSDIYARAHHIIYGSKAPIGPGARGSPSSSMVTKRLLSKTVSKTISIPSSDRNSRAKILL